MSPSKAMIVVTSSCVGPAHPLLQACQRGTPSTRCPWPPGPFGACGSVLRPADPDLVFAALVRATVEPAVELLGHEACVLDQGVPLGRRQPVEREARALLGAPDGERERPSALVPVGALEDARLALEPDAVGLLDVLGVRCEDVEHEAAAGLEERGGGRDRAALLRLVRHVEE